MRAEQYVEPMTGVRSRWRSRSPRPSGHRRRRRGVSDVVATILLLALTVTLFASIFAFVTSFPPPPAQNNNQFLANLVVTANQKNISGIKIVHLAGPVVPGGADVYLKDANDPTASEFTTPYTVSSGLSGATLWSLGQTWSVSFPSTSLPSIQDNITIYIISATQLLFSVILPGTAFTLSPTIVATSVSPAVPVIGQSFTVYATLAGSYGAHSVYVNLVSVPGGPTTTKQMTQNAQGQWTYTWSTGAAKNGTFTGFVNASSPSGQQAIGTVVITISSGTSGGATLTLTPVSYNHTKAETVTLVGAGFSANSTVEIFYNGTIPTLAACSSGTFTSPNTVKVTASGAFSCTYSIAASTTGSYPTTVAFTAADITSGQIVTTYFVRT